MRCPSCEKEGFAYLQKRPKLKTKTEKWIRTEFKAKCRFCNYEEGEK